MKVLDDKRTYLRFLDLPVNRKIMDQAKEGFARQGIEHNAELEITSLRAGQNFWVAPEMVSVIDVAFPTMPDEEVLLEEPPAPQGFLLMGKPFIHRCSDNKCSEDHPFIGVHWRPTHRVLPANDYADEQHDDGLLFTWLAPTTPEERQWMPTPFSPVNAAIFIPAGRPLNTSHSVEAGAMSAESAVLCNYIRAMWTLMQQPLAASSEAQPYRALRRRLQKEHIDPSPVTVVTLRRRERPAVPTGDGEPVDWSHRWVVRGHWRNQWHPRLRQHRAMWINEHVKGPEDKPLVVKDKVIVWRR
jgi:hypothetical protein